MDEHQHVDGLGDKHTRDGDNRLLDKLFEPVETRVRGIGVNGGEPAGVARVPCFQHVQGLGTADLADDDPVRPEPEGGTHQVGERYNTRLGAERHMIGGRYN